MAENPRKTRTPATIPGVERRWTDSLGWRFRVKIRVNGRTVRGSWTSNPEKARRDAQEAKSQVRRMRDSEPMNLGEAIDAYFSDMDRRGVTDSTRRDVTNKFRNLRRFFRDDLVLESITRRHLDDFRDFRRGRTIGIREPSPQTIERDIDHLGILIRFAQKLGRFTGPDPTKVRDRIVTKRKERGFYTPAQIHELIACYRASSSASAPFMPAIVTALFTTGFRITELCRLRVSNIDFENRTWRVERKKSIQSLPMCETAARALREIAGDSTDLVYTRSDRENATARGSTIGKTFNYWKRALPPHLADFHTPHTFRHSFQTQLLESGAPVHHVVKLMDHATGNNMTLRYAHTTPGALRETLEAAFDGLGL